MSNTINTATEPNQDIWGDNLEAFLTELAELSRRRHLGIAGAPVLFEMESDDYDRTCRLAEDGTLDFT